jgi:hypothetical protein
VRRHATASTAGSTQRQATRLGRFIPTAILAAFGAALLFALSAAPALAAECPNEIRRQEQGVAALALPDCRAYENASPGNEPHIIGGRTNDEGQTSLSGNQILYSSVYPAVGELRSGRRYVSTRGPGGWLPKAVTPQEAPGTANLVYEICAPQVYYSPDFSKNVLMQDLHLYPGDQGNIEGFCERSEEALDPREEPGYRNLFLREGTGETYDLLSVLPEGAAPGNSFPTGASDDFSKIFFRSEAQLTPEAPGVTPNASGGYNLFVWSAGTVHLVTFLPDGTPVQGSALGNGYTHGISADGARVFFAASGGLYVRLNPDQPSSAISGGECTELEKACTVQLDATQGPGTSGGGHFRFASRDGSKAFFTSDKKLTVDSTAVSGKPDLYEFDVDTGVLADLTVHAGEPAGVWGVTAFADDGSDIYITAQGALAPGAIPGTCDHYNEGATCSLYHLHEGAIDFVAAISVDDIYDPFFKFSYNGAAVVPGAERVSAGVGQASPNGRYFAFESYQSITGYDNTKLSTGNPVAELFLYDSTTEQVECISCPPSGEPPAGFEVSFQVVASAGGLDSPGARVNHALDDGRVFFDTSDPLVPADVNGNNDVYQWQGGEAHLISTGTDPAYSDFVATTPSGNDVFFTSAEGIVPSDTDGAVTMYDARVGGGFPEPPPLPGCESEACRGAGTSAPSAAATGTAAFQGAGNLKQRHKRDCGIAAKRAQKVSRAAKRLRRKAKRAQDPKVSKRLRQRSAKLAKQSRRLSKGAKRCRRANRRAGK